MIDYFTTQPLLAMSVCICIGLLAGALASYWLWTRPEYQRHSATRLSLQEAEQTLQLHETEKRYELERLNREVGEQQAELDKTAQKLSYSEQQAIKIGQENATLRERISHLDSQERRLREQEDRIIALSQQRSELQTQLEQERRALAEQADFIEKAKKDLKSEFELTANKLFERKTEQFNQSSQSLLEGTLNPFKTQLRDFRQKVEDVYEKENAERNRLSGQIVELQNQAHKISEDAVNLAQALKGNNKTQGGWGEVVLERLLEQSGLQKGREYDTQMSFSSDDGSRRMPDVVIHLPEGKDIIVDAKVSLTDYERYCNCDNEKERERYLHQHISSLRTHIKSLSAKDYEALPGIKALDFVFIFIPIEAAFMLALQYEPNLYKEAYDKQIILASPTTLLAILRTVDNIWRYEKQNKNAERIANEAGALHDHFVLMVEQLEKLGGHLEKTRSAYDNLHKKLSTGRGNLLKRVDNVRKLGAKTKKTIDPSLLEAAQTKDPSLTLDDGEEP